MTRCRYHMKRKMFCFYNITITKHIIYCGNSWLFAKKMRKCPISSFY